MCVCVCGRRSTEFERGGGAQLQKAEDLVAAVGRRGCGVPSSIPNANTAPSEGAAHTHSAGDIAISQLAETTEHEPDTRVDALRKGR